MGDIFTGYLLGAIPYAALSLMWFVAAYGTLAGDSCSPAQRPKTAASARRGLLWLAATPIWPLMVLLALYRVLMDVHTTLRDAR